MGCYYNQYHRENIISWIFHQVNSKDGVDFAMLLYPTGKAGGHQIPCCQGFAVNDYSFILDALDLKPSGFCNVGLKNSDSFTISQGSSIGLRAVLFCGL